jgi:hypothetical protein
MFKTFVSGLIIALVFCALLISPVLASSLSIYQGTAGTSVVITISEILAGQPFTLTWDGTSLVTGNVPTGGIVTFTVPETYGGAHTLTLLNSSSITVFTTPFILIPTISITPTTGTPGTTVTVTGQGFATSEGTIQVLYDSTAVVTGITAGSNGSWSSTITIPTSTGGSHNISASGATTQAVSVGNKAFTITPTMTVTPTAGGVGTVVTVKGSGFAASEGSIKITFDGKDAKTGLSADASGTWSTTITIPSSYSGNHVMDAGGATTAASSVADVNFSVAPGITIDKDSITAGDSITVTGSGFAQNESNIFVTIDGVDKSNRLTADDTGNWNTTLTVTGVAGGSHTVSAHGSSTSISSVTFKTLSVQSKIVLSPATGYIGDTVTVTGSGFTVSKTAGLAFGATSLTSDIAVDTTGTISTTFKVPKGKSGPIKVTVTDTNNIAATATFTVDQTPPPIPKIDSPGKDGAAGFIGDAKVDFKWNSVTNRNGGITYDIQVASEPNFNAPIFQHTGLSLPEYKSTEKETLPNGEYYYRIRAIDAAGNTSDWTEAVRFKAGLISTGTFIIIIVVLVVVLAIFLRARAVFKK